MGRWVRLHQAFWGESTRGRIGNTESSLHQMLLSYLPCGVSHRVSSSVSCTFHEDAPRCISDCSLSDPVSWRYIPASPVSRGHISHSLPDYRDPTPPQRHGSPLHVGPPFRTSLENCTSPNLTSLWSLPKQVQEGWPCLTNLPNSC